MKVTTNSGLRGTLIEFISTRADALDNLDGLDGYAVIKRDDAPFRDAPFSTHSLFTDPDGNQCAESGHYDMTLEQARADLLDRVGRG